MHLRYDELDDLSTALPGARLRLATSAALDETDDVLSSGERARCAGFGSDARRRHFALGRLAVRALAGGRLGVAPGAVPLAVAPDGAVELDGHYVSISHGGEGDAAVGLAALADRPIGVDVEPIRARRSDLWTRILRADERPALDALGGPSDRSHTLLWSMKEAILKGQRTGLRAGARSVRLELTAVGARGGAARARAEASGTWRLRYQRRGDLWLVAALADAEAL